MKKYVSLLVVIIIVSVIGMGVSKKINNKAESAEKEEYMTVEGEEVKKGDISNHFVTTGTVAADKSVNIIPTVPAIVEKINVQVGDKVKKGDLLFSLEDDKANSQLIQAKAGLDTASGSVRQAEIGVANAKETAKKAEAGYELAKANYKISYDKYQFAKENLEKYTILFNEGAISETEYKKLKLDASESTLVLIKKQLEQAEQTRNQAINGVENANLVLVTAQAGYKNSEQSYNMTQDAYNDMTFEAPMDGYITSINIVEHAHASNTQPAMVIDSTDIVKIKTSVTENVVNKLKKDSKVEVTIGALENKVFKGKITTLSTSSNARSLLYEVTIEIENKDHTIKPGMFAEIKFQSEFRKNILNIKSEAIFYKDEKAYIYVAKDNNLPELREVKTGIDNGHYVEILKGIKDKEIYIYKGVTFIDEDTPIKVVRGDE